MSIKRMLEDLKSVKVALNDFLEESKKIIQKHGGVLLNSEPCVVEDDWLISMFYFKENTEIQFIFTCINETENKFYAITSENSNCPPFLIAMANQMYQRISGTNTIH